LIHLTGWASDWDTTAPTLVAFWTEDHFNSTGPTQPFDPPQLFNPPHWWGPVFADQPRPDVDAAFHRGANVGFDSTVNFGNIVDTSEIAYVTVCVVALNDGRGDNTILGCLNVSGGAPG
jgi:hypothetical protein